MKELWVPVSAALAQQRKVENLANNVANSNTPGFKQDKLTFKEYLTALDKGSDDINLPNKEWRPEDFYHSYGAQNSFVKVDGSHTDHAQGQLTPTNNPFDLALFGKGFLEVLTPNGIRYTRNGSLTLNSEGQLVTTQGFKVLSPRNEGGPEQPEAENRFINIPRGQMTVNLQGEVFVNGQPVNKLSVVEFKDINALSKEGSALFINDRPENIENAKSTAVHQGFVEKSNVNAVQTMSELIKANRHFDSIQKVIQTYDSMAGKTVNDVSNF